MVMRNGGIRDRGHKIFMHIGLSPFFREIKKEVDPSRVHLLS